MGISGFLNETYEIWKQTSVFVQKFFFVYIWQFLVRKSNIYMSKRIYFIVGFFLKNPVKVKTHGQKTNIIDIVCQTHTTTFFKGHFLRNITRKWQSGNAP